LSPADIELTDLVLVAPNGTRWRWLDYEFVVNRHGREVRVERLEGTCRACRANFEVTAKLPIAIFRKYYPHRHEAGDIEIVVLKDRPIKALGIRNCPSHRWSTYVYGEELL
jgi:hypothetical protein